MKIKEFAKKLVSTAGISENGNRAAVVSFAMTARRRIACNDFNTTETFLSAIHNLEQNGKLTNMEEGLSRGNEIGRCI